MTGVAYGGDIVPPLADKTVVAFQCFLQNQNEKYLMKQYSSLSQVHKEKNTYVA